MPTSGRRHRVRTGVRWLAQPWRSFGLLMALVASFAFPAFMAASADVFRVSAGDSITRSLVEDAPDSLDVNVFAAGPLSAAGVDALEQVIPRRLARFGRLAVPTRSIFTRGGQGLGLAYPSATPDEPPTPIIGSGARFLATEGAVDALDIVAGDRSTPGLWVSTTMAERIGVEPGEIVAVDGSNPVPIAGIYRDLWEQPRDPFWEGPVNDLIPRYSRVLAGPNFEVIVADEAVLLGLGIEGAVRWEAPLVDPPATYDELARHDLLVRTLERSFTESASMVEALTVFVGPGGRVPVVATDTTDVRMAADALIADLEQPIATASLGGIAIGLLVTAAGAGFAVRKRETEIRLLRADGDAWWRFALRALAQYAAPAAIGGALGVAAAWIVGQLAGDDVGARTDVISLGPIVVTAGIGLLVAAAVTAVAAVRVLDVRRSSLGSLRASWLLPVLGVAVAAWIQVGAAGEPGRVDALVLAFPLVGLVAGVGAGILGVRWLMQRAHRRGHSLPTPLFLAWRRVSAAEPGAVLLSAAMGIALGLIVFSTTLVGALSSAADAKSIAVVGGRTRLEVSRQPVPEFPDATTSVRVQSYQLTVGDRYVSVVPVDPATYASGVSWHPHFGGSATRVVDALETPVDADVAAVLVGGQAIPRSSGFGSTKVFSYEVVDELAGAPLASAVYPTIIVSAPQLDEVARTFHNAQRPPEVEPEVWDAEYRSPLQQYRQFLVSQLDETTASEFAVDAGLDVNDSLTLVQQRNAVANQSARWTFGYLGVLAIVAGLAAIGTLLFYLSERRSARELSAVMAARMGLRRSTAAVAAVIELLGLVLVAFGVGTLTALLLAGRVFDRFEPDSRQPPNVGLAIDWGRLLPLAGGALAIVVGVALATQMRADRRSYAEVLRGS